MEKRNGSLLDSPLGKLESDGTGSPVGVVRIDAAKSYADVGLLLQEYINEGKAAAWEAIKKKIDYTCESLDFALAPLASETDFAGQIKDRLAKGQKLFFKPNLVNIFCIDPESHAPSIGSRACTEWSFVAALMRWFHDKLKISYHQMAIGEAATTMPAAASLYSLYSPEGRKVTVEAVIEGRSGDFYGGWGFFFARKYLSETLAPDATDDPMKGYEESVDGIYIPPGLAVDKLMVYDLNRLADDPSKGREVPVADGVNFTTIGLHKAIVGSSSDDSADRRAYPGCVLVNCPKLKVHAMALFTNVIKNLGIGLYPMQYTKKGDQKWDYSCPHSAVPGFKGGLPHAIWVAELDDQTGFPRQDSMGEYLVKKTGGINATMIDVVKAVIDQGIFMIHVIDGIEAINIDHQGSQTSKKAAEGMVFAGLDPVAMDLLCARYMFSNIPLDEALKVDLDDGHGGRFPQTVPIPEVDGKNIVTRMGYDCCLARDKSIRTAEQRGLGKRQYHVLGHDRVDDLPLVSLQGHLGRAKEGVFSDMITKTFFFGSLKIPWDLQRTCLNYFDAVDRLTGSTLKQEFLAAFDEDGDGIVHYDEFGKKGMQGVLCRLAGDQVSEMGMEKLGYLRAPFRFLTKLLRNSGSLLNLSGSDLFREFFFGFACIAAMAMSKLEMEGADPFLPGMTWGKGKWPSFQLAWFFFVATTIFGKEYPMRITFPSLYSYALLYADITQNGGRYSVGTRSAPDQDAINRYATDVAGGMKPLDFVVYVPFGYDNLLGVTVPNMEATMDESLIMTARFAGGCEIWT